MDKLTDLARQVRALTIRSIARARSGHPGGSLSAIDIMTILHAQVMRPQPYHPDKAQDIFILSSGHKTPALYSLWAVLGYITEAEALSLRKLGSRMQGHPSLQYTPWVYTSTGSLGQGFAVAVGYALSFKRRGLDRRVYVLLGDGDCNEGIVTEAARIAVDNELNNLVCIVDSNGKMSDEYSRVMVNPVREFASLNWGVVDEVDGHSFVDLQDAFNYAQLGRSTPLCIVANTVKAKGVPSWERQPGAMHGSVVLSEGDVKAALEELNNG